MHILIVDDDPDTRALVARALAQEFPECETHEAGDMASLERALAEASPDILISDFDLRWTDGLRVLDLVKAKSPPCCSVMFTGTGNEERAVQAMKHGFDDYIVKGPKQLRRLATSTRLAYDRCRERRELEENRDLVLQELYHRLHNNLQVVISLMNLTFRAIPDEMSRSQIADLMQRIQTLSALQEQFFRSPDFRRVNFASFLGELTRNLVASIGRQVTLKDRIESLTIPVVTAVPLALIANEIITTALKHGSPDGRGRTLTVRLTQAVDRAVLTVASDAHAFEKEDADSPRDLSMHLVRRLASQIDAEIVLSEQETGSECQISIPL